MEYLNAKPGEPRTSPIAEKSEMISTSWLTQEKNNFGYTGVGKKGKRLAPVAAINSAYGMPAPQGRKEVFGED